MDVSYAHKRGMQQRTAQASNGSAPTEAELANAFSLSNASLRVANVKGNQPSSATQAVNSWNSHCSTSSCDVHC